MSDELIRVRCIMTAASIGGTVRMKGEEFALSPAVLAEAATAVEIIGPEPGIDPEVFDVLRDEHGEPVPVSPGGDLPDIDDLPVDAPILKTRGTRGRKG